MAENQEKPRDNKELEQNKKDQPMSHMQKVIVTGFFGGVFWSLIGYIAHYFNFTELGPALILQPWAIGDWKNDFMGHFIGILVIGIISIGAALLYNAFLSKFQKLWPGILFGVALWIIVFYLLNPIFPDLEEVQDFKRNTIITTICLYILYGVFVGYSISYDANDVPQS
ncbi:YqhR family membrane protein [Bacillus sp. Marseille-P3661]|uniref:YqhR family membrane protein n=1 Tax=Bacillus sp. Marseille-P3661 TaxID=1936234 RepID=UPI000C837A08|nr:YqhR family membrane protein [Bacillus sp. Marseille-P3661]